MIKKIIKKKERLVSDWLFCVVRFKTTKTETCIAVTTSSATKPEPCEDSPGPNPLGDG